MNKCAAFKNNYSYDMNNNFIKKYTGDYIYSGGGIMDEFNQLISNINNMKRSLEKIHTDVKNMPNIADFIFEKDDEIVFLTKIIQSLFLDTKYLFYIYIQTFINIRIHILEKIYPSKREERVNIVDDNIISRTLIKIAENDFGNEIEQIKRKYADIQQKEIPPIQPIDLPQRGEKNMIDYLKDLRDKRKKILDNFLNLEIDYDDLKVGHIKHLIYIYDNLIGNYITTNTYLHNILDYVNKNIAEKNITTFDKLLENINTATEKLGKIKI